MEIIEITKIAEKLKWMSQFRKNYSGSCHKNLPSKIYEPGISRFFKATKNGKELGFIRITNKSYMDSPLGEIWCISEVYVKPPYRGQGVQKKLITFTQQNCYVHMIFIEEERFQKNWNYFQSLDLGSFINSQGDGLAYIYDKKLTHSISHYSFNFLKRFSGNFKQSINMTNKENV